MLFVAITTNNTTAKLEGSEKLREVVDRQVDPPMPEVQADPLPEEIFHTGGGMFVIRKEFPDWEGSPVLVSISNDTAIVFCEEGGMN